MTRGIRRRGLGRALARLMVLLSLAAGAGGSVSAQGLEKSSSASGQLSAAEIHDLFPAESIPFSAAPPLMLLHETKCDLKGNIYLVESWSPPPVLGFSGLSALPVSKLVIDSKSTVAYPVPSLDRYRGVVRFDFDVSADGHLYSLLQALDASATKSQERPSFFIVEYHDDGSVDSYFKLGDAPERHMQPFRFAMFRDGNVLVTGTAVADGEPLRPFIAVLNRAGKFATYVKVSDGPKLIPMTSGARGPAGEGQATPARLAESETSESESDLAVSLSSSSFIVSAPDDNVYMLRGAARPRLYVISSAGEVIREFDVSSPVPGLTATNMGMAGDDSVFISFGRVQGVSPGGTDSKGPYNLISVMSPRTGEVRATYRLPAEADAFNIPACAASTANFLFVGATADNKHQQVRRYLAR